MLSPSRNITFVEREIRLAERWRQNGHKSGVLWLTGLSASGKSTLSLALERALFDRGWQCIVLDGDNLRHGVCADLGFSHEDRAENIRRAGQLATLLASNGIIVIGAFISPYRADRDRVRAAAGGLFHEVWLSADLDACEARDPKGLYKKARAGEIAEFTGITAPYEQPERPHLVIDTSRLSVAEGVARLLAYAERAFLI